MKKKRFRLFYFQISFFLFLLLPTFTFSQTKIEILNAEELVGRKEEDENWKRLVGNVQFKQEDVMMYCDSANLYPDENNVDAFGHVHIIQGDSMHIYGDSLKYFGNTQKAYLYHNVRLTGKNMELTTDELEYDTDKKIGTYYSGATLKNIETTLTSVIGHYISETDNLLFRQNVVLTNPDYTLHADTLRFNEKTSVTYFEGPTHIYTYDKEKNKEQNTQPETHIYCEDGWYDTEKNMALFIRNVKMKNESRTLSADSVYYDKNKQFGKAINNIEWVDTAEKIIINSDYAEYFEKEEFIVATKKAIMTNIMENDSLYLSADTLKSENLKSVDGNSNRVLYAYHHAKIFKKDLQADCDSIFYSEYDSTFRFFKDPVLWSGSSQLKADTITMNLANSHLYKVNLIQAAFLTGQAFRDNNDSLMTDTVKRGIDSLFYNQIKGKNIFGYFVNDELDRMMVQGNGQSIYYGKNDDNEYLGVNKTECSNMWLYFKDNKLDKINFLSKPDATFFPIQHIQPSDFFLKNFIWLSERRPKSKMDLLK